MAGTTPVTPFRRYTGADGEFHLPTKTDEFTPHQLSHQKISLELAYKNLNNNFKILYTYKLYNIFPNIFYLASFYWFTSCP